MAKKDENQNEDNQEVVDNEEVVETDETGADAGDDENDAADRPEINFKKELERKNKEIERLRQENMAVRERPKSRDQNDLGTWSDHELKAIKNSNDPSIVSYKEQAEEILLERKVKAIRERERVQEKRAFSDLKLRKEYPESQDASSEFSVRMDEIMQELDLDKTPSGRLAAAKIVAGEMKGKRKSTTEADRDTEASRVRDVKSQMLDGDRSRPNKEQSPKKKLEESIKKVNSRNLNDQAEGMSDILISRGLTVDKFFKR